MEKQRDEEMLEGARLALLLASRLVYLEPQDAEIESFVKGRVFQDTPFGAGNKFVDQGLALLDGWCERVASRTGDLAEEAAALRREWLMLFIGAGTPKAPSWESFYTEPNSQIFGKSTLDVRSWYRRYGLQIEKLYNEPDDNLGLMLGFVGHLIELEEQAEENKDQVTAGEEIDVCDAQKVFLSEHVLPWLPAWHYQTSKYATSDYYRGVADLVFGLVQAYAERFGIEYRPDKEAFVATASRAETV